MTEEVGSEATLDWCSLTLPEKVIVVLGVSDKPIPLKRLMLYIFLLDKAFKCNNRGRANKQ